MGATSVTGTGLGSADGKNRGSEHMTLGVEKLIGPRVMIAEDGTLDGSGDLVVQYPPMEGVLADYMVQASDAEATAATAVGVTLAMTATVTTVTLKGTASQPVSWSVIKKGVAI